MQNMEFEVEEFLAQVRLSISDGVWEPADRKKNNDTLAMLGWKWKDAVDAIMELSYTNYFRGPEPDEDFPNDDDVWMFKKICEGQLIYIKLIVQTYMKKRLLILSFHIDGW